MIFITFNQKKKIIIYVIEMSVEEGMNKEETK